MRIDQSQHNDGPTNKVRHACAYAWRARQFVQKGIGEAHVFLLTRASWAEPNWIGLFHFAKGTSIGNLIGKLWTGHQGQDQGQSNSGHSLRILF